MMLAKLIEYPTMTFIWAEISFLSMQTVETQTQFQQLLDSGRLEVVTGGYVMHDEANTYYTAILEQLFYGKHKFGSVKTTFCHMNCLQYSIYTLRCLKNYLL
jgi:hypothetical protein